jgi:hypothetical protein
MFIVGGIMISRPGMRIGLGLDAGIDPGSLEIAQFATRPLLVSLVIALVVAAIMRETYPRKQSQLLRRWAEASRVRPLTGDLRHAAGGRGLSQPRRPTSRLCWCFIARVVS